MSTDVAVTKKRSRGPRANSKSGAVRAYLKRRPDAGPTEISKSLKKKGIDISPAHVSNVKAALKKAEGGEETPVKRRGRPGRKPRSADSVSLASLLAARQFIESVGGVEKANELIVALSKLRG